MSAVGIETFEQQVQECLAHYYDYTFLQNHTLVHALVPTATGDAGRVQRFREVIEQAIECLKPTPEHDASSKLARLYNILFYRYVNQEQVQQISYRLNLGERQYYRDHNRAIQALSHALLDLTKNIPVAPNSLISVQSEIQRVRNQSQLMQIDVRTFLQKMLTAVQSLTVAYNVTINLQIDGQLLLLASDHAVLRQTIIWILSQLIIQSAPNSRFNLLFQMQGEEGQFIFEREAAILEAQQPPFFLEHQETLRDLVRAVGGRVEQDNLLGENYELRLIIPLVKRSVLIIDDNPDAITLFRRYLLGQPYQILSADHPEQALQLARELSPALIVLDVILPQQDGWEILQSLKSHPSTRHIPVLVCSVLDSPELAHVLGAEGFLLKPPSESHFLDALNHLSQSEAAS